jgi:hypothetical protein
LSDYPTEKAWERVAKMLFPAYELVKTSPRDRWLIKHYPPTDNIHKHRLAPLLPGGITYISGVALRGRDYDRTPEALKAEIDQAYCRQSFRKEVGLWFTRRGFDLKQPTLSKQDFEAALANKKPSAAPRAKPTSDADLATFKRDYLAKGGRPSQVPFVEAARNTGINATRERLRAAFPAKRLGRPIKSPKK